MFWTVCTPKDHHWNCAFKLTHRDVIWHTHGLKYCHSNHHLNYASRCDFGVHTVKTTVFRILIQNAHFELKFQLRTLLSCENSLNLEYLTGFYIAIYGVFRGSFFWLHFGGEIARSPCNIFPLVTDHANFGILARVYTN